MRQADNNRLGFLAICHEDPLVDNVIGQGRDYIRDLLYPTDFRLLIFEAPEPGPSAESYIASRVDGLRHARPPGRQYLHKLPSAIYVGSMPGRLARAHSQGVGTIN